MKKGIVLLFAAVAAAVALAGCHTTEHTRDQGGGDFTEDLELDVAPEPEVTDIRIIEAPPQASANETFLACWEVEGRGVAELTSLYFDNKSHADQEFGPFGASVTEHYRLGFVFPNNTDERDPDGYPIGMAYCAQVPMIDETLYMRAYVLIDDPPGELSPEHEVLVSTELVIDPSED